MSEDAGRYSRRNLMSESELAGAPVGAQKYVERGGASQPYSRNALSTFTTGQNLDEMANGWNTAFLSGFVQNYNKSLEQGGDTLNWFRDKKDGVALWDDEEAGIKFGDVFQGGVKRENLYDTYGKDAADNIMRPMVMSATEQANGFSLEQRRQENSKNAAEARTASSSVREFNKKVDSEKDEWDQDSADTLTFLGGATGGAVSGAGVGSVFAPGVGTAVGAVVGGIAGGVGALLNRDAIQDQVARTNVTAELAEQEGGGAAKVSALAKGWAGVSMNMVAPVSNLVQGVADTELGGMGGTVGDREAAYYATDPVTGERKRHWGWDVANLAGGLVGGVGSFGSTAGRALFTAQMSGSIAGGVGELVTTGGQTFDDSRGAYDNIFYDDQGNVDVVSGAAGVGVIGIDALQLGLGRGIMKGAAQLGVGQETKAARALGFLTGTRTKRGNVEELGGMRFVVKDGKVVSAGASLSVLAPSELAQYSSTRMRAMLSKRGSGSGITADDLYRAATDASKRSSTLSQAMINAIGEGAEEGAQEALDSLSHGHSVDWGAVGDSFLAGAAMGAGMTIGARGSVPNAAAQRRLQYNALQRSIGEPEMSASEWKKYEAAHPGEMEAKLKQMAPLSEVMKEAARVTAKEQAFDVARSDVFAQRKFAAVDAMNQTMRKSTNEATDTTRLMTQGSPEWDDHHAMFSIRELAKDFANKVKGLQQIEQGSRLDSDKERYARVRQQAEAWRDHLEQQADLFYGDATDEATQAAMVDALNQDLQSAWQVIDAAQAQQAMANGTLPAPDQLRVDEAFAITSILQRSPTDNPNSVQLFLPQISLENSRRSETDPKAGRGDGIILVSNAPMQGMGGDFDGDKLQALARLVMNPGQYMQLRTGTFLRSNDKKAPLVISTPGYEVSCIEVIREVPATRAALMTTIVDLFSDFKQRMLNEYGSVSGINEALDGLIMDIRRGDAKAKDKFFKALTVTGETDVQRLSQYTWTNIWFAMNTEIRRTLVLAQRSVAAANAKENPKDMQDSPYAPYTDATPIGRVVARRAATVTQSLWANARGADIFRKWQSLNYSRFRSSAEQYAEEERSVHSEMAQEYARMSSGMTESKLDSVLVKDPTVRRVVQMLRYFAGDAVNKGVADVNSMLAVANIAVPKFDSKGTLDLRGSNGKYDKEDSPGPTVTLLQWIIGEVVNEEAYAKQGTITPQDESRWNRLRRMDAGSALVTALGGFQMRELLGMSGDVFGGNLTLSQVAAQLINKDEHHRKQAASVLRRHAEYNRPAGAMDAPYTMPKDGESHLTGYTIVVDALLEATKARISFDPTRPPDDQVRGEIARASKQTSAALRSAFEQLRENLQKVEGLDLTNRAAVVAALTEHARVGDAYLNILQDNVAVTVLDGDQAPAFLVDALMAKTPAEAEAILWRGLLVATWRSQKIVEGSGKSTGRSFYDLNDRFQLLLYRLAQPGNELRSEKFWQQVSHMTDVYQLMAWLNNEQNLIRQNEAPYTPWNSDLATIDPSYSAGRLSQTLSSPDIGMAISEFHKRTEEMATYLNAEKNIKAADDELLRQLEDAIAGGNDREAGLLDTLQKRIEFARDFKATLGPRALYNAVAGNLLMLKHGTDKGKSAEHVASVGAADMLTQLPSFGTAEEARLASLTSYSLSNVMSNPTQLVDSMELMDDKGNIVEWEGLTAEKLVELFKKDRNRPLIRSMMFPSVFEEVVPGKLAQRYLTNMSLSDLTSSDTLKTEIFGEGASQENLFRRAALIDGATENHDFMRYVGRLAAALTSKAQNSIQTQAQAGHYAQRAITMIADLAMDLAPLIRPTGTQMKTIEIDSPVDPMAKVPFTPTTLIELIREAARAQMRANAVDTARHAKTDSERIFHEMIIQELGSFDPNTTYSQEEIDNRGTVIKVLRGNQNDRLVPRVVAAYGLLFDEANPDWMRSTAPTRERILQYVNINGSLVSQFEWSKAVVKVREHANDPQNPLVLSGKEWEELSAIVAGHALQNAVVTTSPGHSVLSPKTATMEDLKYFDPSYEFLLDDLLTVDSPILKAALRLSETFGAKHGTATVKELTDKVLDTIGNRNNFGPLTNGVTVNMLQMDARINSASAEAGIQAGGLVTTNQAAEMAVSRRTYEEPDEALLSKVELNLASLESERGALRVTRSGSTTQTPLHGRDRLLLEGQFIRDVKLKHRGQQIMNPSQTVVNIVENLFVPFNHQRTRLSDYRPLSLGKLRDGIPGLAKELGIPENELELEMEFFHPDDRPLNMPNNIYFDGVAGEGDRAYDSLPAALWASVGGPAQSASTTALQASKKSQPAISVPRLATEQEREALKAGWENNIGEVVRRTAYKMMDPDSLGKGRQAPEHDIKGYIKTLQLRTVVRETAADGTITVYSFDEALDRQRQGNPFDSNTSELVMLSAPASGALYGSLDQWSKGTVPLSELTADMAKIRKWKGTFDQRHMDRLPSLFTGGRRQLTDGVFRGSRVFTRLSNTTFVDAKEEAARNGAFTVQAALEHEVAQARKKDLTPEQQRDANARVAEMLRPDKFMRGSAEALARLNIPVTLGDETISDLANEIAIGDIMAWADKAEGRMGHVYRDAAKPGEAVDTKIGAIYGYTALSKRKEASMATWVAPHDVVVVELDSFTSDDAKAAEHLERVLKKLIGFGADVALVTNEARSELVALGRAVLRDHRYRGIPGSTTIYTRDDADRAPVNVIAAYDQLVEMGPRPTKDLNILLQSDVAGVAENSGIALNPAHGQMKIIASSLLPLNFPGFGLVPPNKVQAVKDRIAKARDALLEQSGAERGSKEERALQTALDRVDGLNDSGLPPTGERMELGDIIPLFDPRSEKIILYRFGHEAPSRKRWDELVANNQNIILYSNTEDSGASAMAGDLMEFTPLGDKGAAVTLRVPIQQIGAKVVQEGTGFKITLTAPPENWNFSLPELAPGLGVEMVISPDDSESKNNWDGRPDNMRDAAAFYGLDLRPIVTEALMGSTDPADFDLMERMLVALQKHIGRYDVMQVDNMMKQVGQREGLIRMIESAPDEASEEVLAIKKMLESASAKPEAQIVYGILTYLMWKDARPQDVLFSPGVLRPGIRTTDSTTWMMPTLFTQYLDMLPKDGPAFGLILEQLQSRFPNDQVVVDTDPKTGAQTTRRLGWKLLPSLRVRFSSENAEFSGEGWLQFSQVEVAPTSIEADSAAGDRRGRQGAGMQLQQVFGTTTGVRTFIQDDLRDLKTLLRRRKDEPIDTAEQMYAVLNNALVEPNVRAWKNYTAREMRYILQSRAIADAWRRPLNTAEWETNEKAEYIAERDRIAAAYGMTTAESFILDTWVRQIQGRPDLSRKQMKKMSREEIDAAMGVANPRFEVAMNGLALIEMNQEAGLLPTAGAAQPRMHALDLARLYDSAGKTGKWLPLTATDGSGRRTDNWTDWLHIALSIGDTDNEYFDPVFLTASDSFLHSYMDTELMFTGVPVSSSASTAVSLNNPHDAENTEDARARLLSDSPHRAELLGMAEADMITWAIDPATQVSLDERRRRAASWRRRNTDGGMPIGTTQKDMVLHGIRLVNNQNTVSGAIRTFTHLRAFNALLHPLLVVGAPAEQFMTVAIDDLSNLLMGQATRGPLSAWSTEDKARLSRLNNVLGDSAQFRAMIGDAFKQESAPANASWVEKKTAKMSAWAGRIQDPYYGWSASGVARRYMDSLLSNLRQLDTQTNITPEMAIAEMENDPAWAEKTIPALHNMAMATIKNQKSTKPTTASLLFKNTLDPLTSSPRLGVSMPATLTRLQFMFMNYGFNLSVRMLGLQGVDAFVASMLHGRKVGPIGKAWHKAIYGIAGHDTSMTGEEVYDLSEVIENVDITQAFVKSGISLTSLFAFGVMAGGFGLTGEDDEDRRRRRAARFQGAAYLYDPRDIANDFRNADAIYLDRIPLLSDLYRVTSDNEELGLRGRSMGRMNFVVKQFMSPLLGMSRFFANGNPAEILWGFEDAIGSLPLIDTMGWEQASASYMELMAAAEDKAATGNPADLPLTYSMMIGAMYNLERMFLENSFINSLYISSDRYDRDPWKIVETNAVGETVTDRMGNPQATGAMESYPNELGGASYGYKQNDWLTAQHMSMTEKRLGLALLTEIFPGSSPGLRHNMAIKTRSLELNQIPTEEGLAIMRSLAAGADPTTLNLGTAFLTMDQRAEIKQVLFDEAYQRGLDSGLKDFDAKGIAIKMMYGDPTNPESIAMEDVLFGKGKYSGLIPTKQQQTYMQLNTSYVKGPDGNYWATGVSRHMIDTLLALGPLPTRYYGAKDSGLPTDNRLNSVDDINGLNTGMRALERIEESYAVPDPFEGLKDAVTEATKAAKTGNQYTPRAWTRFGRRRSGGGGGGGGGGGSFTRLNAPQDNQAPYTNTVQNINVGNPIIRRATIRRERSDSDKGRLKPWQ